MSQYDPNQQQPYEPLQDYPYPGQQPGNAVQPWQQPQYPPVRQPYYQQQQVSPRSPALGLIVSIFLPGVGSMMAGHVGKGVGILIGYIIGAILSVVIVGIFIAIPLWIWGLVAGYQDAVRWNRAHGIIS
jgi:TM2 domain-containing membrane protein YozV